MMELVRYKERISFDFDVFLTHDTVRTFRNRSARHQAERFARFEFPVKIRARTFLRNHAE